MSNNVNPNALKYFIVNHLGITKLAKNEANKYDIKQDEFKEANQDENNYLELDEILDDSDLYEKFATLYVENKEEKAEEVDKEKQKDEENKVKDKNGAGNAK